MNPEHSSGEPGIAEKSHSEAAFLVFDCKMWHWWSHRESVRNSVL